MDKHVFEMKYAECCTFLAALGNVKLTDKSFLNGVSDLLGGDLNDADEMRRVMLERGFIKTVSGGYKMCHFAPKPIVPEFGKTYVTVGGRVVGPLIPSLSVYMYMKRRGTHVSLDRAAMDVRLPFACPRTFDAGKKGESTPLSSAFGVNYNKEGRAQLFGAMKDEDPDQWNLFGECKPNSPGVIVEAIDIVLDHIEGKVVEQVFWQELVNLKEEAQK